MKKALIIGVGGFVGPYLVKEMADNGYEVFGMDNKPDLIIPGLKKYFECDLLKKDQLTEIAKGIYNDKDKYPDDVIPGPEDLINAVCRAVADPLPEFIIHSDNRDMMSYRADDCEITNYRYVAEVSFGEIVK